AKLAKSTVNQSQAAIWPVNKAVPFCAARSRRKISVTTAETTSVTKITGLRARCRGSSLRNASTEARLMMAESKRPGAATFEDMGCYSVLEGLPCLQQEVFDDRPQCERREILQQVEDDDHADQQPDEERSVRREGAGRGGRLLLGGERSCKGQHRRHISEAADEHRE